MNDRTDEITDVLRAVRRCDPMHFAPTLLDVQRWEALLQAFACDIILEAVAEWQHWHRGWPPQPSEIAARCQAILNRKRPASTTESRR